MLVDYAFPPHPTIAQLKAAGVTAVSRYLSRMTPNAIPKIITSTEFDALHNAGFDVLLNWEYDAKDFLTGTAGGRLYAGYAVTQAMSVGYPPGCAIVGSADTDVTRDMWLAYGRPHYIAFSSYLRDHGYVAGIYGPWDVLQWARDDGVADVFWQAGMSTSWSGGRNIHRSLLANIRQLRQITIGGCDCDVNEILTPNYGQYRGDGIMIPDATLLDFLRTILRLASNGDTFARALVTGETPATYLGSGDVAPHWSTTANELHRKLDEILTSVSANAELLSAISALNARFDKVIAAVKDM